MLRGSPSFPVDHPSRSTQKLCERQGDSRSDQSHLDRILHNFSVQLPAFFDEVLPEKADAKMRKHGAAGQASGPETA